MRKAGRGWNKYMRNFSHMRLGGLPEAARPIVSDMKSESQRE